jgi:hypothetical protein
MITLLLFDKRTFRCNYTIYLSIPYYFLTRQFKINDDDDAAADDIFFQNIFSEHL